jgi:hypothetical protein
VRITERRISHTPLVLQLAGYSKVLRKNKYSHSIQCKFNTLRLLLMTHYLDERVDDSLSSSAIMSNNKGSYYSPL